MGDVMARVGRGALAAALGFAVMGGTAHAAQPIPPWAGWTPLDAALEEQMQKCWTGADGPASGYLPRIAVRYGEDGRLLGQPRLLNLPVGPGQISTAAAALAAVRACDPLRLSRDLRALRPGGWRQRAFRFDREMGFAMALPAGGDPADARWDRLPPEIQDRLDTILTTQIRRCFEGHGPPLSYVAEFRASYGEDGHLEGQPSLLNPSADPENGRLAAAGLAALRACDPLRIPADLQRYRGGVWGTRVIRFDPDAPDAPVPTPAVPPAAQARLDAALTGQIQRCFRHAGPEIGYRPEVAVRYGEDGRLEGEPALLNLPVGPEQGRLAASALAALRACDPLRMPPELRRYRGGDWRSTTIRFRAARR